MSISKLLDTSGLQGEGEKNLLVNGRVRHFCLPLQIKQRGYRVRVAVCLQSEPGGEGQCVSVEAAVCAGQWSGHSVLRSGTNHDEEGILGGLCREKQRADIRQQFFPLTWNLTHCVVGMCMGVWECVCLYHVKYFLGMHRLSPVSVTMQIAVLGIGTDNKVEYTTHTLNICVDTTTQLPVVLCLYMTILLSNSRMCNVLVSVGTEMQVPVHLVRKCHRCSIYFLSSLCH